MNRLESPIERARGREIPLEGVCNVLRTNYYSVRELAKRFHWSEDCVQIAIGLLHQLRQVHIVRYRYAPPAMALEPVFKWGRGVDARCPKPGKSARQASLRSGVTPRLGMWGM